MGKLLTDLSQLSPQALAAFAALAGAIGGVCGAIFTAFFNKFIVTPFLSARDKQDREVEWRKHAIELSKLDLERKIKSVSFSKDNPLRPSILDFLANYRDLQELGQKSPAQLYKRILEARITTPKTKE